jgi:hypothetical protein
MGVTYPENKGNRMNICSLPDGGSGFLSKAAREVDSCCSLPGATSLESAAVRVFELASTRNGAAMTVQI